MAWSLHPAWAACPARRTGTPSTRRTSVMRPALSVIPGSDGSSPDGVATRRSARERRLHLGGHDRTLGAALGAGVDGLDDLAHLLHRAALAQRRDLFGHDGVDLGLGKGGRQVRSQQLHLGELLLGELGAVARRVQLRGLLALAHLASEHRAFLVLAELT